MSKDDREILLGLIGLIAIILVAVALGGSVGERGCRRMGELLGKKAFAEFGVGCVLQGERVDEVEIVDIWTKRTIK